MDFSGGGTSSSYMAEYGHVFSRTAKQLSASLTALIHTPPSFSLSLFCNNILVQSIFKIWKQFQCYFGLQTFSFLAPLSANPVFHPSLIDGFFSLWSDYGMKAFSHLYIAGTFASFQQLSKKFYLPRQHFFFLYIFMFVVSSVILTPF